MNSPRVALVAMLVAVEVLIAGFAVWSIKGSGPAMASSSRANFVAKPIAPIEAGSAPHLVVDDPDSRVEVGASSDGRVHVTDLTSLSGWMTGDLPAQLTATRTPDGVRVERKTDGHLQFWLFGESERKISIETPPGSRVEIVRSSGADVSDVNGAVTVRSQDGHVTLSDLTGTVDASSSDGYVTATRVKSDSLAMSSNDGRLELHDVTVQKLDAHTSDGRIIADRLTVAGAQPSAKLGTSDGSVHVDASFAPGGSYDVSSNDGRIELGLANGADLAVDASTNDGHIYVDGQSYGGDDANQHSFRLGSGTGTLNVHTGDGSIHVTTNGAF